MSKRRCWASICLLALFAGPFASGAGAQRRAPAIWPEVHPNRTVTFRLQAPGARRVLLDAGFLSESGVMTKDGEGLWSITTQPLDPEIYEYRFDVDGLKIADPVNPFVKVWRRRSWSMVQVPGAPATFLDEQNVPHGTVRVHRYRSQSLDVTRGLYVYTPPGYETAAETRYPVLYLLHGSGDTEDAWTIVGRANVILDNALAAQRAAPMIVVMPYGHTPGVERARNRKAFETDLIGEVIPFVEKNYRVRAGSEDRAIAGLSMGGGQALRIGLGRPEFPWIAAFSSAVPSDEELERLLAKPDMMNEMLNLLWVGCGRKDFLFEANQRLLRGLQAGKIEHTAHITAGKHEWRLWRHYLNEVLPLLFRAND